MTAHNKKSINEPPPTSYESYIVSTNANVADKPRDAFVEYAMVCRINPCGYRYHVSMFTSAAEITRSPRDISVFAALFTEKSFDDAP